MRVEGKGIRRPGRRRDALPLQRVVAAAEGLATRAALRSSGGRCASISRAWVFSTVNATRRFAARPSGVSVAATPGGSVQIRGRPAARGPRPGTPGMVRLTEVARACESRRLYDAPPRSSVCPSTLDREERRMALDHGGHLVEQHPGSLLDGRLPAREVHPVEGSPAWWRRRSTRQGTSRRAAVVLGKGRPAGQASSTSGIPSPSRSTTTGAGGNGNAWATGWGGAGTCTDDGLRLRSGRRHVAAGAGPTRTSRARTGTARRGAPTPSVRAPPPATSIARSPTGQKVVPSRHSAGADPEANPARKNVLPSSSV